MMNSYQGWSWPSIFAGAFFTGGAITLTGCLAIAFSESRALAQVTNDNTLNTQVTPNGNVYEIRNGTPVNRPDGTVNLFHSFGSFSVPAGWTAEFLNGVNVANIFGRVTGGTVSDIQGIIKAQGQANLFLINPAGIIFGPKAQLNIGGSFVGTTANSIRFLGGGEFPSSRSPVDPNNSLLAVNPNALFFNQTPAGAIVNQSTAGLQVKTGQNLFLVGGEVRLENGGTVRAPGGRIELGGLAESGEVEIVEAFDRNNPDLKNNPNLDFPDVTLEFPEGVERSDVSLINGAVVDVVADNGGDIFINARNINISGGSNVCAGIGASGSACDTPGSAIGSLSSTAGNIALNATGTVSISQSRIENNINPGASGNFDNIFEAIANETLFGSIIIFTDSLSMTDGAQVSTSTFGEGSAGVVFVQASGKVFVDNSDIFSSRYAGDKGDAGGIVVEANSISLNNSTLQSKTSGQGDGGVVALEAESGTVSLNNSQIRSDVTAGAVGNGRGILIKAGSISLTNQSELQAQTAGEGNAGDVILQTNGGKISLDNSKIFATVESGGEGNGGNILIQTGSLSLNNGSGLQTLLRGPSDDGTLPGGAGNAGVIVVLATDSVSLSGESGMFSRINPQANGNTGDNKFAGNVFDALLGGDSDVVGSIFIATGTLSLTDASELDSSTFGEGNAGAVVVLARDAVSLKNGSAIYSRVEPGGVGDSGGIVMGVGSLSVTDESLITTSALGQGNPGFIIVKADKDILLRDYSGIFSRVGEDNTTPDVTRGGIFIDTRSLFVKDGATVRVDNDGGGVAGDIEITAHEDIILNNDATITALSASGQGGNINLKSEDFLLLLANSEISTQAGSLDRPGSINGGNIKINTRYVITAPFSSNDFDAEAFKGAGGRIEINADRLYDIKERPLTNLSNDISATSGYGEPGEVSSNVLNVDPTQGLANLPANPVDPTTLIAETCAPRGGIAQRQQNRFIVTGRGGLPPDPNAAFPGEAGVNDLGTPEGQETNTTDTPNSVNPASPTPAVTPPSDKPEVDKSNSANPASSGPAATATLQKPEPVEAQGWVYGKNGDIVFTAQAPTITPNHPVLTPTSTCNVSSQLPQ